MSRVGAAADALTAKRSRKTCDVRCDGLRKSVVAAKSRPQIEDGFTLVDVKMVSMSSDVVSVCKGHN